MDAVRPWLYIGKLTETRDAETLRHYGVGAMLQLAEEERQPGVDSLYLDVEDGEPIPPEVLGRGVAFLRAQKAAGRVALVACGSGVSRSAAFAIAALKEDEGLSLLDALRAVTEARREARPHPALWQSLCAAYGEDVPLLAMLRACYRTPGVRR